MVNQPVKNGGGSSRVLVYPNLSGWCEPPSPCCNPLPVVCSRENDHRTLICSSPNHSTAVINVIATTSWVVPNPWFNS